MTRDSLTDGGFTTIGIKLIPVESLRKDVETQINGKDTIVPFIKSRHSDSDINWSVSNCYDRRSNDSTGGW